MGIVDLSLKARPSTTSADAEPIVDALDLMAARVEQGQDELQNLPLLEPRRPADVDTYHPLHDYSARRRIDRNVGWIQQWLAQHADDSEPAPEGLKRTMEETLFMIPSAGFTPAQTKKLKDWLTEKSSVLVARSPWWRHERRDRLETATNRLLERAGEVVTTEQRIGCLWRRYSLLKSIGGSERDQRLTLYALYDIAEKSAGEHRPLLVKVIREQRDLLKRLGGRNRALEDTLFLSTRLLEKTPAAKPEAPLTFSDSARWKPLDAALSQVESGNIPEARRLLQQILDRPPVPGDAADRGVRNIARSVLIQETQTRIDRTLALIGALSESRFSEERWSAGRNVVSRVLRHVRDYLRSLPPEKLPRSFEETLKGFAAKNPAYRQDYESFALILNDMGGAHTLSDYSSPVPEEKGPVWALVHAMDRVEEADGVKNALTALESVLDNDTSYLRGHGDLEGALLSAAEMLKGYTSDRSLQREISKFQVKVPSYESWGRIIRQTVSARTVFEIAFCLATGVVAGSAGRAASVAMRTRLVAQVAGKGVQAARLLEGLELGTFTRQTALIRTGMAGADVSANTGVFSLTSQAKDAMADGRVQNPIATAGRSFLDIGLLQFTMSKLRFMPLVPRALLAGGSVMQAGKALRGEPVTFQGAFSDMAFALGNDFAGHYAGGTPETVSSEKTSVKQTQAPEVPTSETVVQKITRKMMEQMKANGMIEDYVYRTTHPQYIQNGIASLNPDSIALVANPYVEEIPNPRFKEMSPHDIEDFKARGFRMTIPQALNASDLPDPGLNVATMALSSKAYGGSESVLIRFRLRDVPNLRIYRDVGGALHTAYYVTGSGPVPVEIVREGQSEPVLNRMMDILGVTDDTYVYRASKPQWIQNGRIGLNKDSVALVHDPYNSPELLTDIQSAYSDAGAPETLFDSMWENGTKASALENPGLNVSTNEAEILSRYGGGPGSGRALVRIRLGDIPNARLYPDVGGGRGDKTIFYVTGEGSSVPVEVYDHDARSWVTKNSREIELAADRLVADARPHLDVLGTAEEAHAAIEDGMRKALERPEHAKLLGRLGLEGRERLEAKLRTKLRSEWERRAETHRIPNIGINKPILGNL